MLCVSVKNENVSLLAQAQVLKLKSFKMYVFGLC